MVSSTVQKQKRLAKVWEPLIDTMNQTYPDQADFIVCGDGNGFSASEAVVWSMAHIIHDFLCSKAE